MQKVVGIAIVVLLSSLTVSFAAKDIYAPNNDARLDPQTNELRKEPSEVGDGYHVERATMDSGTMSSFSNNIKSEIPVNALNQLNSTIPPNINAVEPDATGPVTIDPDNTGINKRDRYGANITPLDQSADPEDISITQQIRKALVDDGNLSLEAKNIKIITISGIVTLRGVVRDEKEKNIIEARAAQVSNVKKILNQLEVDVH